MRRTTALRATVVLGATAALAIGLTATAATGNASAVRLTAAGRGSVNNGQVAANAVAQRLQSAVSAYRLPGFGGVEVNPSQAHPGVAIYWHGRVPALLARIAAGAGAAGTLGIAAGVTVQFRSAPYTQAQLLGLRNALNASPGFEAAGISSMGFFPQATGFWINVNTQADLGKARRLVGPTRIRVHYAVSPGAMLSFPGRYKDTPPFWGGDFIQSKLGTKPYECSSGFGMHFANKKGAPWFMLTAGHCIIHSRLASQRFWIMGNRKDVGVTFTFVGNDDAANLVTSRPYGVPSAGGGNEIYIGGTSFKNSTGQKAVRVLGAMALEVGDVVSTSGAFSGQCNGIKIKTLEWEWPAETVDGLQYRVFGALAIQSHHRNAAGRGDSGGPVFVQGKGGVKAVGIISATESTRDKAPCTGVDLHRGCFWSLELPLMTGTATSIEAELNVKVNT